jgi:hypothetical protein
MSHIPETTLPARVSAHAPQLSWSPSHYFLSDLMENTTLKVPLRVLVESTDFQGQPHTLPQVTYYYIDIWIDISSGARLGCSKGSMLSKWRPYVS